MFYVRDYCLCKRTIELCEGGLANEINPIIYILIEIAVRELDSKLLTALFLAKKGFRVIVGFQWELTINRDRLPKGIFFFKGMNKIHTKFMAKVRQFGHIVVAMEEELLDIGMEPPEYYDYRDVFHTTSNGCHLFLASHGFEMKFVKQLMPDLDVRLTGNPRTDFLRSELVSIYDPVREEISKTMSSSHILINTNPGMINSILSPKRFFDIQKKVSPKDKEWLKRYKKRKQAETRWEAYNLKSTFQLIELFGRQSPRQKVLIRPHPAEKLDTYVKLSRKYPNVNVANNNGSANPWILASDILIHTGCTTGAEAVSMGHPTISIQEKGSEHIQFRASNNVSYLTHTAEEAYQAVQNFYAGKLKLGDASKLKELWPAQEGKFAAERIADEIHQLYLRLEGSFEGFKSVSVQFRELILTDFEKQKMDVEFPWIEHRLRQMYELLPNVPPVKLDKISRNVFYISPV